MEADLVFEGLLLFSDPPKADIGTTIAELAFSGRLKVVTGDSDVVARAVATQAGLEVTGVLTGDEMRGLTPRHSRLGR